MVTLGQRIRTQRALRGLSQAQLARQVGVERSTLSYYESDTYHPRPDTLVKIEAALDIRFFDPPVEVAFSILANDAADADNVRAALAVLEAHNGQSLG